MVTSNDEGMLRENIDTGVKAVVKIEEKWRALCAQDSSSAYTETYFRETNEDSTDGGTGSPIRGLQPLSPFPFIKVTETEVSTITEKYAAESLLSMEAIDDLTVPMLQRHIYRIGRKIIYQIDTAIHSEVSDSAGNSLAIAAGSEWDSATIANRDPVKDILDAIQELREDGIDALAGNGYLVVNGQDYTNIISNTKVLNHPTYESGVMKNGKVGKLLGLTIVVSEVVTADQAYVLVAKQGMVWKSREGLKTNMEVTPGKSTLISAWERGVFQLQVPNEICKITNTRK
jgi:hypothetical protein